MRGKTLFAFGKKKKNRSLHAVPTSRHPNLRPNAHTKALRDSSFAKIERTIPKSTVFVSRKVDLARPTPSGAQADTAPRVVSDTDGRESARLTLTVSVQSG